MIPRKVSRLSPSLQLASRAMTTSNSTPKICFGRFEVTDQVFHSTPLSFGLVNIKPLLPGHVLVVPHRAAARLTDLTAPEISDLFCTVQKVQRMLARVYFGAEGAKGGKVEDGSFNIAIQDGEDAGQSVPHVHCHIIPRLKGNGLGDGIYDRMASEEGNVGGALWDREREQRPSAGGQFPKIEDADRKPRSKEEMKREAEYFMEQMLAVETDR